MTSENRDEFFWKEWQDILLAEFEGRVAAVGIKGQGIAPASKTLTVLFLQVKGFSVPAADILPEAIRTIKEKDALHADISPFDKVQYDTIAMMGHHIGMVDNSAALKQYLQDVRTVLEPEGQILLTSLDIHAVSEQGYRLNPNLSSKQFQQVNLIGPFFHMWRIKADTLKSQAVAANWHCELIYRQDDSNYFTRLSLSESG
jgi:hypothetical protein